MIRELTDGTADSRPRFSIVVPTLNEEDTLPHLLADLRAVGSGLEIVVADGGSVDATVDIARDAGARVLTVAPPGRGAQLRAGAEAATAPVLCFLHADVRLNGAAVLRLASLANDPPSGAAAFRLRIDSDRSVYRFLERGTNFRARLGLPYGDQGLVVTSERYWAAGGHPPIPLMEDVAVARAMRDSGGIRLLDECVAVSPRRWEAHGPLRRTFLNLSLLLRYLLGADPAQLAQRYRPAGAEVAKSTDD